MLLKSYCVSRGAGEPTLRLLCRATRGAPGTPYVCVLHLNQLQVVLLHNQTLQVHLHLHRNKFRTAQSSLSGCRRDTQPSNGDGASQAAMVLSTSTTSSAADLSHFDENTHHSARQISSRQLATRSAQPSKDACCVGHGSMSRIKQTTNHPLSTTPKTLVAVHWHVARPVWPRGCAIHRVPNRLPVDRVGRAGLLLLLLS